MFLEQESRSGCSNKIGNLTHGVRSSNKIGCFDISQARDAVELPNLARARVRSLFHENVFNVLVGKSGGLKYHIEIEAVNRCRTRDCLQ